MGKAAKKKESNQIVRSFNHQVRGYAEYSECGTYRYMLKRILGKTPLRWRRPALFIMLNPSTATESILDPTVRRCVKFAEREHCTSITVVNLFALRSTDPRKLKTHKDPVGPLNEGKITDMILETHSSGGLVVVAWGSNPMAKKRGTALLQEREWLGPFMCLGLTKDGSPRHPLYVKMDAPLREMR